MHLLIQPVIVVRCLTKFVTSFEDRCSRRAFIAFAIPTMVSDLPFIRCISFALLLSFVDPVLYALHPGVAKESFKKTLQNFWPCNPDFRNEFHYHWMVLYCTRDCQRFGDNYQKLSSPFTN